MHLNKLAVAMTGEVASQRLECLGRRLRADAMSHWRPDDKRSRASQIVFSMSRQQAQSLHWIYEIWHNGCHEHETWCHLVSICYMMHQCMLS